MAAKHNLAIRQGATFTQNIVVKNAAGTVIDLTGYTGRAHLRLEYTSEEYTAFAVTIPTPTNGTINISLTAEQTEDLEPERHVYDVELVSGATVHRVVQGNATVYPEVTKDVVTPPGNDYIA